MDMDIDTKPLGDSQIAAPSVEAVPDQAQDTNPKKRPREDDGSDDDDLSRPAGDDDDDDATPAGEVATAATGSNDADPPKLSKNQMRKQKRQKLREERKSERKLLRKEARHAKTAQRRQEREDKAEALAQALGIDRAAALRRIAAEEAAARSKLEAAHQKSKGPVPVAFVIDCDFERYMRDNELVSLAGQVTRSYSMNRNGLYQAHIVISSWGGKLKERFDTALKRTHENWKGVTFVEGDFVEAGKAAWEIMTGPKGGKLCSTLEAKGEGEEQEGGDKPGENGHAGAEAQDSTQTTTADVTSAAAAAAAAGTTPKAEFSEDSIIYLSADSPHTLDKLEPNTSYVIGGLVDRNREKLLCQTRAEAKGIRTAKLPIGEYMQMASRQVLATNHVVEIMSRWLETGDWGRAFMEVIPKRKGGHLKGEDGEVKAEGGEEVDGHGEEEGEGEEEEGVDNGLDVETQEGAPVNIAA